MNIITILCIMAGVILATAALFYKGRNRGAWVWMDAISFFGILLPVIYNGIRKTIKRKFGV